MVNLEEMKRELASETSGGGTHGAYQDVLIDGQCVLRGHRRTQERLDLFGLKSYEVAGSVLVDIGCNLGQICGYYSQWADAAIGTDINPTFLKWAGQLFPKAQFVLADLNKVHFRVVEPSPSLEPQDADYIFFLSVWDYLDDPVAVVQRLKRPGTVIFYEEHKVDYPLTGEDQARTAVEHLQAMGAAGITFLGRVDDGQRPVYRGILT